MDSLVRERKMTGRLFKIFVDYAANKNNQGVSVNELLIKFVHATSIEPKSDDFRTCLRALVKNGADIQLLEHYVKLYMNSNSTLYVKRLEQIAVDLLIIAMEHLSEVINNT